MSFIKNWNSPEDQLLIQKYADGDSEAFSQILEKYEKVVFDLCYRILGIRQDAEDAAQETFLECHRTITNKVPILRLGSWLYTVALNLCRKQARRQRIQRTLSLSSTSSDSAFLSEQEGINESPQAEEDLQGEMMALYLERLAGTLPIKLREAIVLCTFQGVSEHDAASILGITVNNLRVRVSRAKDKLWEIFKKSGD